MKKLTVYYGERSDLERLKKTLGDKIEHLDYTEYDFMDVTDEERLRLGGTGKIVLCSFSHFIIGVLAKLTSLHKPCKMAFVDSFVSLIDESVDVEAVMKPLLAVADVFIFTTRRYDVARFKTLASEIYCISSFDDMEN